MNNQLREELLEMQYEDVAMRRELIDAGELYKYEYHPRMAEVHRRNNVRMREIVARFGWPGRSLAGEDGGTAAWKIAQHAILDSELREQCLRLLKEAVAAGEAPAWQFAMLTDSVLFKQGKPQIYGCITVGDGHGSAILWETDDVENVDLRRTAVGLPPLEENMRRIRTEVDFVTNKQREAEKDANRE